MYPSLQMLEKRLQPSTESFNHILAAYSASGTEISTGMVHSILSEMKRMNVPFDNDTYLAALELFCRVGAEVRSATYFDDRSVANSSFILIGYHQRVQIAHQIEEHQIIVDLFARVNAPYQKTTIR